MDSSVSDQNELAGDTTGCEAAVGAMPHGWTPVVNGRSRVTDRRRSARVALPCRVELSRDGDFATLNTKAENISSGGFYCLVQRQLSVGDRLDCKIQIPVHGLAFSGSELRLNCTAIVSRVANTGAEIGIGCEFEDLTVAIV
jgi:hypothetical protein